MTTPVAYGLVAGLVFGAVVVATMLMPRSSASFWTSAAGAFLMMNEPRLNFLPAASNGSSAASNEASLNL